MHRDAKKLWSFLRKLEEEPLDMPTRAAFSDWLEDHDEPEEAAVQRAFSPLKWHAERTVREFCLRYQANYKEFLEDVKAGDGYCFGDDNGPEALRDSIEYDGEVWKAIKLLLGTEPPKEQRFRCAC